MKKAKKLHLDYIVASNAGDKRHAQEIMRGLGISWLSARPEPIVDCWIFEGCANVPPILPSFIREVS